MRGVRLLIFLLVLPLGCYHNIKQIKTEGKKESQVKRQEIRGTVQFVQGDWHTQTTWYSLGERVYVLVTELKERVDSLPSVPAVITSECGDSEILRLTKHIPIIIITPPTTLPPISVCGNSIITESKAPIQNDGVLQVRAGDKIIVTYYPIGSTTAQTDIAWVKP